MQPASAYTVSETHSQRRRGGCIPGCLMTLVILVIVLGGAWFLIVRPYLHNIATTQLDQVLSSATAQMPTQATQLPAVPIVVQENALNNLIALNIAPSSPLQHAQAHITTSGIRLDFQLYGYQCAFTGVPKAMNGQLILTNVTVEGLIGLIMSPDELTPLLNKHLAEAQQKIHHTVLAVSLKDQQLGLLLG